MPAALDIDREQVRMLVIEIGVREAARRLGIAEATVQAWSARGQWLAGLPRNQHLPPTVIQPATIATTPANALCNAMRDDALQTRASAMRVTRRAIARVERCDDDELLTPEVAGVLHQHVKSAAVAGAWQQSSPTAKIELKITGQHSVGPEDVKTMEADWSDVVEDKAIE